MRRRYSNLGLDGVQVLLDGLSGFEFRPRLSYPAGDGTYVDEYVDTGPIHAEAPEAVRFWGNFFTVSAVFCVDTDEPELIARLTAAIRANQERPDYKAAKRERLGEKVAARKWARERSKVRRRS